MKHHRDCVILGAGPAGLSAALWCHRLGIEAVVLESRSRLGGEIKNINLPIHDLLGVTASSGRDYLSRIEQTLDRQTLRVRFGHCVTALDLSKQTIETDQGQCGYRCLIIATGLRRRRLAVQGAQDLIGQGITYSATTDLDKIAGLPVAVLGGGDGAYENALILAERCPHVTVLQRRAVARARAALAKRVRDHSRVEVMSEVVLDKIARTGSGWVRLHLRQYGVLRALEVGWLVVKIGFEPCTESLLSQLELDGAGHIIVNRWLQTSCPGVFAAGDVSNPRAPSIAAAIGDGSVAAQGVCRYLA